MVPVESCFKEEDRKTVISVVVIQNCMDLQDGVFGSYSEACATACHESSEVTCVTVREVPDMREEEDEESVLSVAVKTEREVSCVYVEC